MNLVFLTVEPERNRDRPVRCGWSGVDNSGTSALSADTAGRSWSTCPELRIRRSRARCVPDEADSHGYWQSLADTSACPLTCVRTGPSVVAHVLLSSRSCRRL